MSLCPAAATGTAVPEFVPALALVAALGGDRRRTVLTLHSTANDASMEEVVIKRLWIPLLSVSIMLVLLAGMLPAAAQWMTRDHRWPPRGPWDWALPRELPGLYREFNGIDFGHAHLAETFLRTQDQEQVERARLEILDFIFSSPSVPPDEDQIAPTFTRMVWEVQRAFNWAHTFHRSLYDLFASDVPGKDEAYRTLLVNYLEKPEAITSHRLDHHGKLWSFPESKAFRDRFRKFDTLARPRPWRSLPGRHRPATVSHTHSPSVIPGTGSGRRSDFGIS